MTKEDKELLLKDLSARIPYGVKLLYNSNSIANIKDRVEILRGITIGYTILFETDHIHSEYESTIGSYEHFKPYLRPMSSMTDIEKKKYHLHICEIDSSGFNISKMSEMIGWLNSIYVDYNGLIPMGLALPAPDGMYNTKNE